MSAKFIFSGLCSTVCIFEMAVREKMKWDLSFCIYIYIYIHREDKAFFMQEEYYNHYNKHFFERRKFPCALCLCSIQVLADLVCS